MLPAHSGLMLKLAGIRRSPDPVTGELHGELHALCGTGIHTNAVDTLVADTPTGFTVMGWYLVNGSPSDLKNYL